MYELLQIVAALEKSQDEQESIMLFGKLKQQLQFVVENFNNSQDIMKAMQKRIQILEKQQLYFKNNGVQATEVYENTIYKQTQANVSNISDDSIYSVVAEIRNTTLIFKGKDKVYKLNPSLVSFWDSQNLKIYLSGGQEIKLDKIAYTYFFERS